MKQIFLDKKKLHAKELKSEQTQNMFYILRIQLVMTTRFYQCNRPILLGLSYGCEYLVGKSYTQLKNSTVSN